MNKEYIYGKIIDWEMNNGESFLDYFDSDMNAYNIMFWIKGKGYITQENFEKWEREQSDTIMLGVQDYLYDVEDSYGIIKEDWKEGIKIIAEFISESVIYQERFNLFMEENK
jgi:hypothetical protein